MVMSFKLNGHAHTSQEGTGIKKFIPVLHKYTVEDEGVFQNFAINDTVYALYHPYFSQVPILHMVCFGVVIPPSLSF